MYYIGIDPGKKGAIAIIGAEEFSNFTYVFDTPLNSAGEIDPNTIIDTIEKIKIDVAKTVAFIERATAMPKQGVKSMFTYGEGYGKLKAFLEIKKIPYQEIPSAKWKKEFSLSSDKTKSIALVEKLFPSLKGKFVTARGRMLDGRAEAILLAEYARRKLSNVKTN